jgi:hypothetical protein
MMDDSVPFNDVTCVCQIQPRTCNFLNNAIGKMDVNYFRAGSFVNHRGLAG